VEQTREENPIVQNIHEELADVLHFMSEQVILIGMEKEVTHLVERNMHWAAIKVPETMPSDAETSRYYGELTYHMAMACHKLKNKPWKQSHRETDKHEFKNHILDFWRSFMFFCHVNRLPLDGLFIEYHKKHAVNKTRQQTGY